MRRSGFTMIELIFVIVILGILASVAIPKLAATRDDAKMSAAATEVNTAISEITSFYVGTGDFNISRPVEMSNSLASNAWLITSGNNPQDYGHAIYRIRNNAVDCIRIDFGNGDLNVTYDTDIDGDYTNETTDALCDNIKILVKESNNSVGGSSVVF